MLHQHTPHGSRRHIEKVGAILPLQFQVKQSGVCLVQEIGGIESVICSLTLHMEGSNSLEISI